MLCAINQMVAWRRRPRAQHSFPSGCTAAGCSSFRMSTSDTALPTLKPIVEPSKHRGTRRSSTPKARDAHPDALRSFPAGSIIFHIDRGDPELCQKPAPGSVSPVDPQRPSRVRTAEKVKQQCKFLIDTCGANGGYIMDAWQSCKRRDGENVQAMTGFTRDYGVYSAIPRRRLHRVTRKRRLLLSGLSARSRRGLPLPGSRSKGRFLPFRDPAFANRFGRTSMRWRTSTSGT